MLTEVKKWIKENFKKVWYAVLGGFIVGILITWAVSWFTEKDINGFVMIFIISAGGVGVSYLLKKYKIGPYV